MLLKKKFYIAVDCEGVACTVGIPGKGLGNEENYTFSRKQATKEANAAAKALFECGAQEVIIWDNHCTGVNLEYDNIDKKCKIALGSGHRGRFPLIDESFGGVVFIGYHSRDNVDSVLAHTFMSRIYQYYKINDFEVGEMEIDASFAAIHNVPVIFVSSDDKTVLQAKESFPWAQTVEVKKSLSWNSAISLHPETACDKIYEGVLKACERIEEMKCFSFNNPLNVEIRFKRIDDANMAKLYDFNGKLFASKDAHTRVGEVDSIEDLF